MCAVPLAMPSLRSQLVHIGMLAVFHGNALLENGFLRGFALEWPCRGGEILLIFCDAGNGCWSCAHHLLSSASTIIIRTICLGFFYAPDDDFYGGPHTAIGIQWFHCLIVLAGNHMEISFATWPKNKRRKITIIMICINFCFIYCYKLQAIKLSSHSNTHWCTPEAAAVAVVGRFSISCPLFILIHTFVWSLSFFMFSFSFDCFFKQKNAYALKEKAFVQKITREMRAFHSSFVWNLPWQNHFFQ